MLAWESDLDGRYGVLSGKTFGVCVAVGGITFKLRLEK